MLNIETVIYIFKKLISTVNIPQLMSLLKFIRNIIIDITRDLKQYLNFTRELRIN